MSGILIFSKNNDLSTDMVIDWILKEDENFTRLNGEVFLFEDKPIFDGQQQVALNVGAVWFRRAFDFQKLNLPFVLEEHYRNECLILYRYNYFKFVRRNRTFHLNKYEDVTINKLLVNELAVDVDLRIPSSYVVSNKKDLVKLLAEFSGGIIFKPLSNIFSYYMNEKVYVPYTQKISNEDLNKIPNFFLPSYIQEYIESDFEIRVVFLKGEFFPMAIFSGGNDETKTDFRNYDFTNLNRMIPFILPKEIRVKLIELVDQLDLNFCSIDLLYSEGKYFFLEVNPVGQFGMVSLPCNFNIEKRISEILIYETKNNS